MIETASILFYTSIDGCTIEETYHSIADAQEFAHHWIGEHPEIGRGYAVSGDGIGKIQAWGVTLAALFPVATEGQRKP